MTIEHVPDPAQLCRDALDLLAPGGALMLVCHDRRAPLNRALGTRSPIMDIEHLQLFSQASARALLERTGFGASTCAGSPTATRCTTGSSSRRCRARAKRALVAGARRGPLRSLSLSLPVGNLAVTGFRTSAARS